MEASDEANETSLVKFEPSDADACAPPLKRLKKTQCFNTGLSFDDFEFPPLPSVPPAFVTSAWPKKESATLLKKDISSLPFPPIG
ncbi:hypothetical protein HNY73_008662 [Argiope bruennichi]|uniref:Uncharacterized protein n=1 Tax=Argiope bruennichi TaxID=94029 RepID=A0A8T0F749_ARGBR|nr:hypothetical protein HNY73_008662 [Argiope bruennichi]